MTENKEEKDLTPLSRNDRIYLGAVYYGLYTLGMAGSDSERTDEDCAMDNFGVPYYQYQLSDSHKEILAKRKESEKLHAQETKDDVSFRERHAKAYKQLIDKIAAMTPLQRKMYFNAGIGKHALTQEILDLAELMGEDPLEVRNRCITMFTSRSTALLDNNAVSIADPAIGFKMVDAHAAMGAVLPPAPSITGAGLLSTKHIKANPVVQDEPLADSGKAKPSTLLLNLVKRV